MTPAQEARLRILLDRVTDSMLKNMDPDKWPGGDRPLTELSRDERGDLNWCLKILVQQQSVVNNGNRLLDKRQPDAPGDNAPTDDDEKRQAELIATEREAKKLLKEVKARAK